MNKIIKRIVGLICFLAFLFCYFGLSGKYEGTLDYVVQILSFVFLGAGISLFVTKKKYDFATKKEKLGKRTLLALVIVFITVPLTIFAGFYFLQDKKYYFISLLIILEIMLPFFCIFEGKKPQARELVTISVLCAAAVAGRAAFFMLPQFKPIIAIVIISGVCFGGETGFLIGAVTGFVSNFMYGQGAWTPWQMFAFGVIGFIAGVLFTKGVLKRSRISLCVFGAIATFVIYGGIMNPASVILWNNSPTAEMIISSFVMGAPFDLIHSASTVFFLWVFAQPLMEKIERLKIKYGIMIVHCE